MMRNHLVRKKELFTAYLGGEIINEFSQRLDFAMAKLTQGDADILDAKEVMEDLMWRIESMNASLPPQLH
jgi:hypothetical protein